jgi:hypothetical protein
MSDADFDSARRQSDRDTRIGEDWRTPGVILALLGLSVVRETAVLCPVPKSAAVKSGYETRISAKISVKTLPRRAPAPFPALAAREEIDRD